MSQTPATDSSQLLVNTAHDTSAQAAMAAGDLAAAQAALAGAGNDHFAQQQAADAMAFAATQHSNFAHQAQQYQQQQVYVQTHNAPVEAQMRAASEQQAVSMVTGAVSLAATVATVGATASVLGGMADDGPAAAPIVSPTSGFAATLAEPTAAEPTTFSTGPSSLFNSRGWNATAAFGIAPSLSDMSSVATAGAVMGVETPALEEAAPETTAALAPVTRARNQAMHLAMIPAPKPNMAFFKEHGGS